MYLELRIRPVVFTFLGKRKKETINRDKSTVVCFSASSLNLVGFGLRPDHFRWINRTALKGLSMKGVVFYILLMALRSTCLDLKSAQAHLARYILCSATKKSLKDFGVACWSLMDHPYVWTGIVAVISYTIYGALWRLYLSPIAHFPGPRMAALTHL